MTPRHDIRGVDSAALAALVRAAGFCPDAALTARLAGYLDMLCRWNRVMNLVGKRCWRDMAAALLMDSFFLAEFLDSLLLPLAPRVWDLGAGAGLPGIPLRMVWQRGVYTLIEAREKRALFLANAVARLGLARTVVHRGRVEDFFRIQARGADLIVSRAFLPWPQVLSLALDAPPPRAMLVILAREAPPRVAPRDWRLVACRAYSVGEGKRWFWGLALRAGHAEAAPC